MPHDPHVQIRRLAPLEMGQDVLGADQAHQGLVHLVVPGQQRLLEGDLVGLGLVDVVLVGVDVAQDLVVAAGIGELHR